MMKELIEAINSLTRSINDFQTFLKDFAEAYAASEDKEEAEEYHVEFEEDRERPQSKALRRRREDDQ
jgi:hypothetical protein